MMRNSKLLKIIKTRFGCTDNAENNAGYAFAKSGFHYQVKKHILGLKELWILLTGISESFYPIQYVMVSL